MNDFKEFYPYLKPYRFLVGVSALLILASVVVGLVNPVVLRMAVDGLNYRISWGRISLVAVILLYVACVSSFLFLVSRYVTNYISSRLVSDIRLKYYAHLQHQSFYFFQYARTSEMMTRATNEMEGIRSATSQVLLNSLQTIFTLSLVLPMMLRISPSLTLLLLAFLPVTFISIHVLSQRVTKRTKKTQDCLLRLLDRAEDNLLGVRVVRAYCQEQAEIEAFRHLCLKHSERTLSLLRVNAVIAPLMQLLIGVSAVIVLWYGGMLAVRGRITIGQFIEFNAYLMRLVWPLTALGQTVRLYRRGMLNLKQINASMAQKSVIADSRAARRQSPIHGRIVFRHLTFSYEEGGPPVLKDIDLTIEPGQTVAFIGRTGSGKTTLANLIPRVIEAPCDTLFIDGKPVTEYTLAQLRRTIGYVQQETVLFSDTLAENIAFGIEKNIQTEVVWAANVAALTEDIKTFPAGFNTIVGERGVTLSGGQKQRTAIARAILRKPKILILDDALSSVDVITERKILTAMRETVARSTTVIISNRLSTICEADMIYILDEGAIVERGTHQQLLSFGGEYAQRYQKELLETELAAAS